MGQILVDTSAWIAAFSRKGFERLKGDLKTALSSDRLAVTGIILLELLRGARNEEQFESLRKRLSIIPELPFQGEDWLKTARLSFSLRRKGVMASLPDILIAGVALRHDCVLYHCDKDFEQIAKHTPLKTCCYL